MCNQKFTFKPFNCGQCNHCKYITQQRAPYPLERGFHHSTSLLSGYFRLNWQNNNCLCFHILSSDIQMIQSLSCSAKFHDCTISCLGLLYLHVVTCTCTAFQPLTLHPSPFQNIHLWVYSTIRLIITIKIIF